MAFTTDDLRPIPPKPAPSDTAEVWKYYTDILWQHLELLARDERDTRIVTQHNEAVKTTRESAQYAAQMDAVAQLLVDRTTSVTTDAVMLKEIEKAVKTVKAVHDALTAAPVTTPPGGLSGAA